MPSSKPKRCEFLSPWGRCVQPAVGELCHYHQEGPDRHDPYYHRKVVEGLVTPTLGWMGAGEERALLSGRRRGDGRRLDAWVVEDPIDPEEETDA